MDKLSRGQLANQFVIESNRIENILRPPTDSELMEFDRFMELPEITVVNLVKFVRVYQPGAQLRTSIGNDVLVGNYLPPRGGPHIREQLENLLHEVEWNSAWQTHIWYESLHPFSDGNGRSGRMIWAWMMGWSRLNLGFLHSFYYQTLSERGKQ